MTDNFEEYKTYRELLRVLAANNSQRPMYQQKYEEALIAVLKELGVDLVKYSTRLAPLRLEIEAVLKKYSIPVSVATTTMASALGQVGVVKQAATKAATTLASALAKSGITPSGAWPFGKAQQQPAPTVAPTQNVPYEHEVGRATRVAAYITMTKDLARKYKKNSKVGHYRVYSVTEVGGKQFVKTTDSQWIPVDEVSLHNGRRGAAFHPFNPKQL